MRETKYNALSPEPAGAEGSQRLREENCVKSMRSCPEMHRLPTFRVGVGQRPDCRWSECVNLRSCSPVSPSLSVAFTVA